MTIFCDVPLSEEITVYISLDVQFHDIRKNINLIAVR